MIFIKKKTTQIFTLLIFLLFSSLLTAAELTFFEVHKDGINGVDGLSRARGVTISPDGKQLYVAGLDDAVVVFNRNTTTGALTYLEVHKDGINGVDGLNGANGITISPDGKQLYVTGSADDAVAVFIRNSTTGALTYLEVHKDGKNGVDGLDNATKIIISPNGKQLYVTGAFDNAVVVFNRNSITGALTYLEVHKDGINGVDGLAEARGVTISPDGRQLYVTGSVDDAVAVFNRNSTTGALTYLEAHKDGSNGVDGLDGANGVTISPDGKQLYVAGLVDDAVAVFNRNTTTGALTYLEVHKDGQNGVDGLAGASVVSISPDGKQIYVTGFWENAVAVFNRNDTTGALTYQEVHKNGINGVDGLNGAAGVTISLDGKHLYVAGQSDDAIVVFTKSSLDYVPDSGNPSGTIAFSATGQTLSALSITTADGNNPTGLTTSYGKISYQVTSPNNGTATVRLTFSTTLPAIFTVYKVNNAGNYTPIPENAGADGFWVKIDANTIDVTLLDNGAFDLNPALGIIDDPIVIGVLGAANAIPTLSFWAILFLTGFLSLFARRKLK
ncbi:MAG: beta-propeller fold lactonase family protein [Pseudomonadota bacterium]